MASASAVASKRVPLAALLKELLASQSGSGKTGASASARRLSISKLFSADSSEDSSDSDEDAVTVTATATRLRERYLSLAKLLIEGTASLPFPLFPRTPGGEAKEGESTDDLGV